MLFFMHNNAYERFAESIKYLIICTEHLSSVAGFLSVVEF